MSAEVQVMPPTELNLNVPPEITDLVMVTDRFTIEATEFQVDSEVSFQVADQLQTTLKAEAKRINDLRMDFTRPIDAIKKKWVDFFSPAVEGRTKAATIYQQKMSKYRADQRAIAEAARRESERLLREERAKLEAEARAAEARAAKLKTETARQKALDDAAQARATAAMVPETVALSAPEPVTVASNVAQIWKAQVVSVPEFLKWVVEHPEWWSCVSFKDAEMNRLARQFRDAQQVPGVKFAAEDSYRTKAGLR